MSCMSATWRARRMVTGRWSCFPPGRCKSGQQMPRPARAGTKSTSEIGRIGMRLKRRNSWTKQSGFTMIEMLIATLMMLVGIVAMAQLVPLAIRLNAGNRDDSTALVLAQRELDEMYNQPMIDFTQAKVANYNFSYTDPNDPFAMTYDIRWAVITYANGANPTGKRFIVGVRRIGGNAPFLPLTLDTMVEK